MAFQAVVLSFTTSSSRLCRSSSFLCLWYFSSNFCIETENKYMSFCNLSFQQYTFDTLYFGLLCIESIYCNYRYTKKKNQRYLRHLNLFTAVVATTTTVVTSGPQQYPQQQTTTPGQPYQHYPPYQPIPVQPGYPAQPMPQPYGAQNMPTTTYQGQPFTAGPPPTYQEASECRI